MQISERLNKKLPILDDNNLFTSYFLMVDDILNGDSLFLSKEQINDIKNIKIENEYVKVISKVVMTILNEKIGKKSTSYFLT